MEWRLLVAPVARLAEIADLREKARRNGLGLSTLSVD